MSNFMIRAGLAFMLVVSTLALHAEDKKEPAPVAEPELADVKKAVSENKAILIDVREKLEWDAGHLNQAALVPLSDLKAVPDKAPMVAAVGSDLKLSLAALPKDKPVYIHCKSGKRALMATELLKAQGYDVHPLKQGYEDLKEAGFPTGK